MTERPIRVLLVDGEIQDSRWVQDLLADFENLRYHNLTRGAQWTQGIDVIHLDRLEETLTLLSSSGPDYRIDVILLNPALPDSYGLPTLLRVQAAAPQIPVLILSDSDDPDLAVSMVRAGAQEFLVKTELDCTPLARALRLSIERNREMIHLRALSWRDALTGLPNASGFGSLAAQQLEIARSMGHLLAAVALEVEGLDVLARDYGQQERSVALLECAELLRNGSEAPAAVGYLGDGRFAAVFPALDARDVRRRMAVLRRRFHKARASSAALSQLRLRLGGHIQEPAVPTTPDDLIREATLSLCENMGGASPGFAPPPEGWRERWSSQTPNPLPESTTHYAEACRS